MNPFAADGNLEFLFRLAIEMRRPVVELVTGRPAPMSLYELNLWVKFRQHYGFPTDRVEWTVAVGSAYTANAMGAKIDPRDVVSRFGPARGPSKRKLVASLLALPGATLTFVPYDKTRPALTGQAALAELTDAIPSGRRTLDGNPADRPKRDRGERRPTLSGD